MRVVPSDSLGCIPRCSSGRMAGVHCCLQAARAAPRLSPPQRGERARIYTAIKFFADVDYISACTSSLPATLRPARTCQIGLATMVAASGSSSSMAASSRSSTPSAVASAICTASTSTWVPCSRNNSESCLAPGIHSRNYGESCGSHRRRG